MNYSTLAAAQRAYFRTGETKSLEFRKSALKKFKLLIELHQDELKDAVFDDLKRRTELTQHMEITKAIEEVDLFLDNLDKWAQRIHVFKRDQYAADQPFIQKDPLGVILIISPWNWPVMLVLLPAIAALAAGNTVIVKPSEMAPHTAKVFEKIIPLYFKPEYFPIVNGGVEETTQLLKERFDHIFYTGCPPVAKIIMTAAAKHLTPVTLELGGKCPVVVESDADIDLSAKRIVWGKWINCGQTCLSPDYVLTSENVKPKLIEGMKKYIHLFYGADVKRSKDYSRIVNSRHFERLSNLLRKTKGTILIGGIQSSDPSDLFITPTVVEVDQSDFLMEEEIFGPILPIITIDTLSEAIDFINGKEKPLGSYIFTNDQQKIEKFLNDTSSGGVTVNDVISHVFVDTLPFGGVGNSGIGRYNGKFGFDTFSHEKAVMQRTFENESVLNFRYPPFDG